jgi:hypothetical protein
VEGDPQFEPADLSVKDTGSANGPEYVRDWDAWGREVQQKAWDRAGSALKATGVAMAIGASLGAGFAIASITARSTLVARGYIAATEAAEVVGTAIQARPARSLSTTFGHAAMEFQSEISGEFTSRGGLI